MDGFMPVEPLSLESMQRCNGSWKPLGKLVLDDRVNDRVCLGVGNLDASMKVADQSNPLTFIKGEPSLSIRIRGGVVSLHVQELFRITILPLSGGRERERSDRRVRPTATPR